MYRGLLIFILFVSVVATWSCRRTYECYCEVYNGAGTLIVAMSAQVEGTYQESISKCEQIRAKLETIYHRADPTAQCEVRR